MTSRELIFYMSYTELAERIDRKVLERLERAYIASLYRSDFDEDEGTLNRVIDLAVNLYYYNNYDHSKFWYTDLLSVLINEKDYTIDDLEELDRDELLDLVYNLEWS